MTSPAYPANDSSDWILRSPVNRTKLAAIDYDPPITAQHVAVIRFDTLELSLTEVMVYGTRKLHSEYIFMIK